MRGSDGYAPGKSLLEHALRPTTVSCQGSDVWRNSDDQAQQSRQQKRHLAIKHHVGDKNRPGIIFLHSDAGNKEQFDSAFDHLKVQGWSLAAFDRRGHGKSSMPKDVKFGYANESGDVFDVADVVGFKTFVIVGHSGGGAVAFKAANDQPTRIAGTLLLDPAPDPSVTPKDQTTQSIAAMRKDFKSTIAQYFGSMAGPDAGLAKDIVATAQTTSPDTIVGIQEQLYTFRPQDYAGKFTGPAHSIIQPEFDIDGALHRIQPGMTHEAIGGAGHWIHMVKPDKFNAALETFLARVS